MLVSAKESLKMLIVKLINFVLRLFNNILPDFLNKNFEATSSKLWRRLGCAFGFALTLFILIDIKAYTSLVLPSKWWLLATGLSLPWIITSYCACDIKIKNQTFNEVWHLSLLFLLPFLTITMTESLNNVFIFNMTYLGLLGNYIVTLIFYFLVFAFSGSIKISVLVVNPILFGFALAHSYIMNFRGTPFLPMDFLSITTAAGVANTYNFMPTHNQLSAICLFVLIILIGIKVKTPNFNLLTKVISRVFAFTFSVVILILFFFTSVFANLGVRPDFWNQTRGYHNYGFTFNFFCNTKYLYVNKPTGYNPENVDDYVSHRVEKPNKNPNAQVSKNSPNIICIMNESLSDLQVLGDFKTNKKYMPFISSLKENTIKGNLYVPVIGAGTSNTEFEFITGHSTAFLPSGSNAYMLYIDNPVASMVSTLEAQGYSSYTFHPYYASGWKRTSVYKNFGFDKFISLENIMDIGLMDEYKNSGNDTDYLQELVEKAYPENKNMLLRQYVSDSYDYELLIKDFERHSSSVPYFAFNVTMQNHGGYTGTSSNFDQKIHLKGFEEDYEKTNCYLSLVKESDKAFKKLIKYFENVDEPTIICMFGDHQPSIETEFITNIMGVSSLSELSLEQEQARHATPFLIWANYDIKEKKIDKLSSNYLSSLVLKTAGVELTDYNKYLLKLAETLPVIDTVGYIDSDDNYYRWSDSSPYTEILDEYEQIQYNNIFDQDNKNTSIFYLENYEYEEPEEYSEELLSEFVPRKYLEDTAEKSKREQEEES